MTRFAAARNASIATPRDASSRGLIAALFGPVCWSIGGAFITLVSVGGWAVLAWRSLFMVLTLAAYIALRRRAGERSLRLGAAGWIAAAFLAAAFTCYPLALKHAEVAVVLVCQSLTPVVAAVLGAVILSERVPARRWLAMVGVAAGIALMLSGNRFDGGMIGVVLALGTAAFFAGNIVTLRRVRSIDPRAMVLAAGVMSALLGAVMAPDLAEVTDRDVMLLALLGCVQLGLGFILFSWGAQRIPAAQAALIGLLEMVLGTLVAALFVAQIPTLPTLIGGAVALAALAWDILSGANMRNERPA